MDLKTEFRNYEARLKEMLEQSPKLAPNEDRFNVFQTAINLCTKDDIQFGKIDELEPSTDLNNLFNEGSVVLTLAAKCEPDKLNTYQQTLTHPGFVHKNIPLRSMLVVDSNGEHRGLSIFDQQGRITPVDNIELSTIHIEGLLKVLHNGSHTTRLERIFNERNKIQSQIDQSHLFSKARTELEKRLKATTI